jgi:hypothetical protein
MYVQVGSYQTPNNASWFVESVRTRISPRGRIISNIATWAVNTVLTSTTQAGLTTLINSHIAGMKQNNVDMAFYEDDGTATAHSVVNSQTANGITYLGHEFPGYFRGFWGAGSEYAEGTALRYVVTRHTAEVFDVEDAILFYRQETEFNIGGVDYEVPEALNGPPQVQFTKQQSKLWLIQRGSAVGMFARPSPPAPLVAVFPKPKVSKVRNITPENQGRQRNWGYGLAWFYYFESPGQLSVAPPDNP